MDSFGTPVPTEVTDVAELPTGFYQAGFLHMNGLLNAWHRWPDGAKYAPASTGCAVSTPRSWPAQIGAALHLLGRLPDVSAAPLPGQAELEGLVALITTPAQPAAA